MYQLSRPVEVCRIQRQQGPLSRVAVAECQGWRYHHEDTHFFNPADSLAGHSTYAVFDGHSGKRAAQLAAELMPQHLNRATDVEQQQRQAEGVKRREEKAAAELLNKARRNDKNIEVGTPVDPGGLNKVAMEVDEDINVEINNATSTSTSTSMEVDDLVSTNTTSTASTSNANNNEQTTSSSDEPTVVTRIVGTSRFPTTTYSSVEQAPPTSIMGSTTTMEQDSETQQAILNNLASATTVEDPHSIPSTECSEHEFDLSGNNSCTTRSHHLSYGLKQAFLTCDAQIRQRMQDESLEYGGCTAIIAGFRPRHSTMSSGSTSCSAEEVLGAAVPGESEEQTISADHDVVVPAASESSNIIDKSTSEIDVDVGPQSGIGNKEVAVTVSKESQSATSAPRKPRYFHGYLANAGDSRGILLKIRQQTAPTTPQRIASNRRTRTSSFFHVANAESGSYSNSLQVDNSPESNSSGAVMSDDSSTDIIFAEDIVRDDDTTTVTTVIVPAVSGAEEQTEQNDQAVDTTSGEPDSSSAAMNVEEQAVGETACTPVVISTQQTEDGQVQTQEQTLTQDPPVCLSSQDGQQEQADNVRRGSSDDEEDNASMYKNHLQDVTEQQPLYEFVCERFLASEDHKPDRPDERDRIESAGGFVLQAGDPATWGPPGACYWGCPRLDGDLALSRGLGDFNFKDDMNLTPIEQKFSPEPEIYEMNKMEEGDLILLACDGILDVLTNEELIELVLSEITRQTQEIQQREYKNGIRSPTAASHNSLSTKNSDASNSASPAGTTSTSPSTATTTTSRPSEVSQQLLAQVDLGEVCQSVIRRVMVSGDNMTMMIVQLTGEDKAAAAADNKTGGNINDQSPGEDSNENSGQFPQCLHNTERDSNTSPNSPPLQILDFEHSSSTNNSPNSYPLNNGCSSLQGGHQHLSMYNQQYDESTRHLTGPLIVEKKPSSRALMAQQDQANTLRMSVDQVSLMGGAEQDQDLLHIQEVNETSWRPSEEQNVINLNDLAASTSSTLITSTSPPNPPRRSYADVLNNTTPAVQQVESTSTPTSSSQPEATSSSASSSSNSTNAAETAANANNTAVSTSLGAPNATCSTPEATQQELLNKKFESSPVLTTQFRILGDDRSYYENMEMHDAATAYWNFLNEYCVQPYGRHALPDLVKDLFRSGSSQMASPLMHPSSNYGDDINHEDIMPELGLSSNDFDGAGDDNVNYNVVGENNYNNQQGQQFNMGGQDIHNPNYQHGSFDHIAGEQHHSEFHNYLNGLNNNNNNVVDNVVNAAPGPSSYNPAGIIGTNIHEQQDSQNSNNLNNHHHLQVEEHAAEYLFQHATQHQTTPSTLMSSSDVEGAEESSVGSSVDMDHSQRNTLMMGDETDDNNIHLVGTNNNDVMVVSENGDFVGTENANDNACGVGAQDENVDATAASDDMISSPNVEGQNCEQKTGNIHADEVAQQESTIPVPAGDEASTE